VVIAILTGLASGSRRRKPAASTVNQMTTRLIAPRDSSLMGIPIRRYPAFRYSKRAAIDRGSFQAILLRPLRKASAARLLLSDELDRFRRRPAGFVVCNSNVLASFLGSCRWIRANACRLANPTGLGELSGSCSDPGCMPKPSSNQRGSTPKHPAPMQPAGASLGAPSAPLPLRCPRSWEWPAQVPHGNDPQFLRARGPQEQQPLNGCRPVIGSMSSDFRRESR